MKKLFYIIGLALLTASCGSDMYEDWVNPMANDPEDAKTITMTVGSAPAVNYAELTEDQVQLFVPTLEGEGTTTYKVLLWNEDKTASQELTTTDGYVSADELKAAVETLYGKRPVARTIAMDITAYTIVDGQSIANKAEQTITVTLKAPFIDAGYYLTGDFAGWNKDGALAFTHVGSGDVYDNPEFQIVFTTTADNQYWKIIPKTNYDGEFWAEGETGVVGTVVDGDTSFEGNLTTTSPQAGKIEAAGIYRMTINMMNYTYTIEKLNFSEYIYEIGNESGWSTAHALYGPNFDGKYQGYYWLDGEFKFKPNADDWNGDWENDGEGKIADNGGNNMPGVAAGFYQIDVDLAAMTYAVTEVTSISIIGDFNGWGGDVDMTYNTSTGAWEATATVTDGGLKFRMNHDWAVSWGGIADGNDYDHLTQNSGQNLYVAAGTYKFQLFIETEASNRVVITKQ